MARRVTLKHPKTNLVRTGFYGFSWTSFFFGGFPAIFRGDVLLGLGVIIGSMILGAFSLGLGGLLLNIVWAFIYNKMYTRKLIEAGYEFADTAPVIDEAKRALGVAAA